MKAITHFRALPLCLALLLAPAAASGEFGGETLANADVIGLARAGMAPALIVAKIQSVPNAFDLSTRALIALKENGVADEVIQAMMLAAERSSAGSRLDQPRFRLELENIASSGRETGAAGLAWMLANREQTLPVLRRSLADSRPEIRAGVVLVLSRMGDRESLPALRNLLADPAPQVRSAAAQALYDMNDVSSLNAAEQAVSRQLTPLDGYARLLGHARLTRAAGPLGQALAANPEAEGRAAAAWALGEIGRAGAAGRPALEKALTDDAAPQVRRAAAEAIAKLRDARSAESLKEACRRDPEVRKTTLEAMADYPETIEFLVGVLNLGTDQIAVDELETARASLSRLAGEDFGLDGQRWSSWFAGSNRSGGGVFASAPGGSPAGIPDGGGVSARREVDVAAWGIVADPSGIPMAPQADDSRPASR
ncbi:MAG: HEAT repeat domain-containing protein, partial [Planctomycetota bacterium]|nr:HEAT repeat domain-containing protein [Planctomycetota bacterium]